MDAHYDELQRLVIKWDKCSSAEVELARKKFEKFMKKGWLAFRITSDNMKLQVYEFDTDLEEIVLIPIVEGG